MAVNVWSRLGAGLYDSVLARGEALGLRERRQALLADARGQVLEVGAGTGLNLIHYPPVDGLVLSEPDRAMARRLTRRVTAHRRSPTVVEAPGERLPFDSRSFDTVVSTLVLCTVPDPARVLQELSRVLRPNGRFLFIEHVRSDDASLARWQDRLQPIWKPFALGCHCNRDTLGVLHDTGWTVEALQRFEWRGMPVVVRPIVAGSAVPASAP